MMECAEMARGSQVVVKDVGVESQVPARRRRLMTLKNVKPGDNQKN